MNRVLFSLLAVFCVSANAEVIAVSGTMNGGEIRLTNDKSNCPRASLFMYIRSPSGIAYPGCWELIDGDVFVKFADQTQRLYDINGFSSPTNVARKGAL